MAKEILAKQQEIIDLMKQGYALVLQDGRWYISDRRVSKHTVESMIDKGLIKATAYDLK